MDFEKLFEEDLDKEIKINFNMIFKITEKVNKNRVKTELIKPKLDNNFNINKTINKKIKDVITDSLETIFIILTRRNIPSWLFTNNKTSKSTINNEIHKISGSYNLYVKIISHFYKKHGLKFVDNKKTLLPLKFETSNKLHFVLAKTLDK